MHYFLFLIFLVSTHLWGQTINHAPFDANDGYSNKAKKFIQNNLKDQNGNYSLKKIERFKLRLENEKNYILKQIYETALIQKIELRIEDGEKALEEASEELEKEKSDYHFLFSKYLLPQIEKLYLKRLEDKNCLNICDGIIDEFIFAYSAVFSPELNRSYIPFDVAPWKMYQTLSGFTFSKLNQFKNEANNLLPTKSQLEDINHCLSKSIDEPSYLSVDQLNELKTCRFDLSKINPGNSPLIQIKNRDFNEIKEFTKKLNLFPKKDKIVTYSKLRFSGFGSPKFTVKYKDKEKKKKVKVKLGPEVHNDPAVATLAKMLGLHQDETLYREQLKVKFKSKKDFDEFQAQMVKKYNQRFRNHLIKVEEDKDEVLVTFRYVLLEANRPDIVKLNGIDQSGWDNLNRREFRSMLLWFAWVNLRDTRNGNWRVQLHDNEGRLTPQISMQDVGQGLMGAQAFRKNIFEIIPNAFARTHLNQFENSIITWSDSELKVQWTDTLRNPDIFSTTTYTDLKWMARKIAKLTKADIEYALKLSGMTEVEQTLYVAKLVNRRNEFVKAFELEDEFELLPNIDIDNYNVDGLVKNGKIIKTSLKKSSRFQTQISSLYHLTRMFTAAIPMNKVTEGLVLNVGHNIGLQGESALATFTKELSEKTQLFSFPGVEFKLTRGIQDTRFQQFEDSSQRFFTVDRLSVEFNLNAGIIKDIFKSLPFTIMGSVKVLKLDFEHFSPAQTPAEALSAPFKIPYILQNLNHYIAKELKAGEIFNFSTAHGVGAEARIDTGKYLRFGAEVNYLKSTPTYFHRNYFGELEIYKDTKTQKSVLAYAQAGLGAGFFFIPFLGVEFESISVDGNTQMYKLWKKKPEVTYQNPSLDIVKNKFEQRILNTILKDGYKSALPLMRLEYDLDYKVRSKATRFFAFIWSKRKVAEYSQFVVSGNNVKDKRFHRFVRRKEAHAGSPELAAGFGGLIYFKGNQQMIEVQVDEDNPDKFVVIQNVYTYKNKLKHKRLDRFFRKLNKSFSKNEKEKFFDSTALPPKHDVSVYKKVLAHNRIFYFGDKFFTRLSSLPKKKLQEIGEKLVKALAYDPNEPSDENRYYAQRILDELVDSSRYLARKHFKKFTNSFSKMIKLLNVRKLGMKPTLSLFKESEIFVAGEIYGLLDSFTEMSEKYTNSLTRRFMGTSYGHYKMRPPIWKFMNTSPVFFNVLPQIYDNTELNNVFGILPTGEPVFR